MRKVLLGLFIIYFNFSCSTNYLRSSQQTIASDDPTLQMVKLGVPLDSIKLYLLGDYFKFEKNKENIWIENREFTSLLTSKVKKKPDHQVLFTFNTQSDYNNVFGFYYESENLSDIQKTFTNTDYYKFQSGITYFYSFNSFKITDTFIEKGDGLLRFINVNNPFYDKDPYNVHFYREQNYLLFDINKKLFGELKEQDLLFSTPYGNYLKYTNFQRDTTALGKQVKATALSFIGDFETRDMMIANLFQYQIRKPFEIEDEFQPRDAKEFILNQTQNQDVVMFNENHMNPENRIFFASMLESFRNQGFDAIAFEALAYEDSIFIENVPTLKSGFYTREPEFGNLLRKAKELGFEIFSYENNLETELKGIDQANFRDSIQAENLKEIYLNHKKLLVFAGHGHIEEKQRNEWKTMAQRFYEITNVNPLTVEQAIFSDLGNASWRNNVRENIFSPSVFINSENKGWTVSDGFFDIQVFFPKNDNWYKENRIPFIFEFKEGLQENIIQIYKSTDDISQNPVPVAIQEIFRNKNNEFYLPAKGDYELVVLTEYGQVVYQEKISL